MKIIADFTKITGRIKPMHAVGQPPMSLWTVDNTYMHYLGEANIPYSRLHDTGGRYGAGVYVDIPNIFRKFDADENAEESYDFRSTDRLFAYLKAQNCEPFYRLGITIENDHALCSYRNFPPENPEKWARICEHIIRHYNEGWADGFYYGLKYFEIWNEPDDCVPIEQAAMWHGSKEDYYHLYEVTACHLKKCFGDSIKVGGYASCGFYGMDNDPDASGIPFPVVKLDDGRENIAEGASRTDYFIYFFHGFLKYITSPEHKAPLDFFSWHSYADVPTTLRMEAYCRRVLSKYGFDDIEDICDEWNTCHDDRRGTPFASASILSMMLGMQKTRISMMNYYDASMNLMNYSGLFNAETHKPHLSYFALMSFGHIYRLENEIDTVSDDSSVYVGGATDGREKVLLLANYSDAYKEAEIDLTGADESSVEILRIDDTYAYSPTGKKLTGGKLLLTPWSCTELRFR